MKRFLAALLLIIIMASLSGCMHEESVSRWDNISSAPVSSEVSASDGSDPASAPDASSQAAPTSENTPPISPHPETGIPITGYSQYARSLLSPRLQEIYDRVTTAVYHLQEKIPAGNLTNEELEQILRYVQRDHPAVDWLLGEYRVRRYSSGRESELLLSYSGTREEIFSRAAALESRVTSLLEYLPDSLDEFNRAVILHDRLLKQASYDASAPHRDDAYGALVDGRAACEGYSRAYQYLLLRAGIESIMVYGMADEAHAWNLVRLNGNYYHADATWDDATLTDGSVFLSHQYLFWDDAAFARTHTPNANGLNPSLPGCGHLEQNYFVRMGTMASDLEEETLTEVMNRALEVALAGGYRCAEIVLPPDASPETLRAELIDSGVADQIFSFAAGQRSITPLGRAFESRMKTLIYVLREPD